jgi:hypothetical protein
MKKFVVLAGLVAVALVLGVTGTAVRSNDAQAKPTDVLSINPTVCYAYAVVYELEFTIPAWLLDENADTVINDTDYAMYACLPVVAAPVAAHPPGLMNPENLLALADALEGDVDAPDTFQVLADATGDQLGENATLWILTWVSNSDAITLEADEGIWVGAPLSSGTSLAPCPVNYIPALTADEDCDADGVKGDEVVVDLLKGAGVADVGDAQVVATQAGVDVILDYVVVGDPDDIVLEVFPDDTVQEGFDASDCEEPALDLTAFTDEIEAPEVNGLLATITDEDGTELTGIAVDWESDDTDVVNLNWETTVSMVTSGGTLAPNMFCGDEIGTATITADAPFAGDADVDVTVIGAPDAMTLTASPASITCDGVASSTVSATLVDSEGNKVVDGTDVRFEVVALGIADPITATTAGGTGAATSKITPLSGVSAGVVVLVTVKDADDDVVLEGNIRIDCALPVAPPPPPVSPTGPTVIPPGTGDGGYLP